MGERMTMAAPPVHDTGGPPSLTITVEDAAVAEFAVVPSLRFRTRVDAGAATVRSVTLTAQIRVAADRRHYDQAARERLVELFGPPEGWGRTVRSLLWTHATCQVPGFAGSTVVDIPVSCTYDFEVAVAKYFHALDDGEVPLEFLFSGTVFYADGGLLRAAHISWETESAYRMPVRVWKDAMDHYFPGSAWLRLPRATFDRLYAFKARNTLATWEDAVEALLAAGDRGGGRPCAP
jgi:hypothetical protein